MSSPGRLLSFLLLLVQGIPGVFAASPQLSEILPCGGARGTTVEAVFHGSNLEDAIDLLFHEEGISLATLTEAVAGSVRTILDIAPEAQLGTHAVRVRTRSGISNPRLFSVGQLAEVAETEPNNDPETALAIGLGTTLNGDIPNEDVDYYAIELIAGQRIAVEAEALRLGIGLHDPKVRLFGPEGHERVAEDDTALCSPDAAFVFTTQETGKHLLAVSESAYGGAGSFRYRLHVGEFPRPLSALPLGGIAGATTEVTWFGDPAISTQTLTVPPAQTARTVPVFARTERGLSPTPFKFRAIPYGSTLEVEPNNEAISGTTATIPGAFEGKIGEPGDVDHFRFTGKAGKKYEFRVWARALGSPLDSVMRILAPSGGEVSQVDDSLGLDCNAIVSLPEDGIYTLSVRDHLDMGGDLYTYRVEVLPVSPEVSLTLLENDPVSLSVPQGNQALIRVSVTRNEFGGPVSLSLPDLPEGLSYECETVPDGLSEMPMVIRAATDAAVGGSLQRVVATVAEPALEGGLNQEFILVYGQNLTNFFSRTLNSLALAVTEPSPFRLEVKTPRVPIVQNGRMTLEVIAHRSPDFNAAIDLRIPWAPPGIGTGTANIPEGATRTGLNIDCNSGPQLGTWKIAVEGSSSGYKVCSPFVPIEIQDRWVTFTGEAREMEQGKEIQIPVKIACRVPIETEVSARLSGTPRGTNVERVMVAAGATEATFTVSAATDAQVVKDQALYVEFIPHATGEEPIYHLSPVGSLSVFEPLPAALQEAAPPPSEPKPEEPERKTRFPKT